MSDATVKLRRAAEILRELGGEENYDLADACEEAALHLDGDA
jgi:hypothetical protein